MHTLEDHMMDWLLEHCVEVTSVTGTYFEDTITGTVTAKYDIIVTSNVEEDLDVVAGAMLSGTANHEDLAPEHTYLLDLQQEGFGSAKYSFSSTSTVSGTELDWLEKV